MVVGYIREVRSADNYVIALTNTEDAVTKNLLLASLVAPRVATKANPDGDEPYGFNAREHMRKQLIGQKIEFEIEYEFNGREYGWIKFNGVSLSRHVVRNGLAKLRNNLTPPQSEDLDSLVALQEEAKEKLVGVWNPYAEHFLREPFFIERDVDETKAFYKRNANKNLPAVVEFVRDGGAMNVYFPHEEAYLSVFLNGVMVDTWRRNAQDEQVADEFAAVTKFFVEQLVFQKDGVTVRVEDCDEKGNLNASIYCPQGNLAQLLLAGGYARIHEPTARKTQHFADLAKSFLQARESKLLRWKNLEKQAVLVDGQAQNSYTAQVIEVVSGDVIIVKVPDAHADSHTKYTERRLYLSNVRAPRGATRARKEAEPFAVESKEFLRAALAGKTVTITVDYLRTPSTAENAAALPPASDKEGRLHFVTVDVNGKNPVVDLIKKGFVDVQEPRRVEDERARDFEEYLYALEFAKNNKAGRFAKNPKSGDRTIDLTGADNAARAKAFEKDFKASGGLIPAIVEHVVNGARFRLRVPSIGVTISAVLAGVEVPAAPGAGYMVDGEPFGAEALAWSRLHLLQREVTISVDTVNRGGNFLVRMFTGGRSSVGVRLLKEGLARTSMYGREDEEFAKAEDDAAAARKGLHSLVDEKKEAEKKASLAAKALAEAERVLDAAEVIGQVTVAHVAKYEEVYLHEVCREAALEKMTSEQIPAAIKANEDGAATPYTSAGALSMGQQVLVFSEEEDCHFRCELTGRSGPSAFNVRFVDFGFTEKSVPIARIRPLPKSVSTDAIAPFALKVALAGLKTPQQVLNEVEDIVFDAIDKLDDNAVVTAATLYVAPGGIKHVNLRVGGADPSFAAANVAMELLGAGDAFPDRKNLAKMPRGFSVKALDAVEEAKEGMKGLFRFGDIEDDEEEERRGGRFGGRR